MKTLSPCDRYSAVHLSTGHRVEGSSEGWLQLCESHNNWHAERPLGRSVTIEDISDFLAYIGYTGFKEVAYSDETSV